MLLQLAGGTAPGAGTTAAPLTPLVSSNHARSWQGGAQAVFLPWRDQVLAVVVFVIVFLFSCVFVLSLCCGLWVCLVWVCWRVFCFKGGGAGPTSRVNSLSPVLRVFTGGLPKTRTHTGPPGLIPGSLGAAAGGAQQLTGPAAAPVPVLQLVWAALSLCHLCPGELLQVLGGSRVCPVSILVRGWTPQCQHRSSAACLRLCPHSWASSSPLFV